MLFRAIRKTPHYSLSHEQSFPWSQVILEIATSKYVRKKGNRLEIKRDDVYILGYVDNGIFYVINAKRK